MPLKEEFEKQGNWLFRWRSYLPLVMLPVFIYALQDVNYVGTMGTPLVDLFYQGLCIIISFAGLAIRGMAIGYAARGTSGRNTQGQAAKAVNTTGLYSIVRHPLYLGNYIIFLGMALSTTVWWLALVMTLAFWLYYERIMYAEEEFLRAKFGEEYTAWAGKTPAIVPSSRLWQHPDSPFLIKDVLRREYAGFFGIITAFTLLRWIKNIVTADRWDLDGCWILFFVLGLIIYLVLRFLKKKTTILNT